MTMGERIKQLRKEKGMTQTDLAMTLNVTKGTVSTWETNSRVPGFETLNALSDLFERRLDYIMGRSDDATPTTQNKDDLEDLALSQVEADLTEYALKYARLDHGKHRDDRHCACSGGDRRVRRALARQAQTTGKVLLRRKLRALSDGRRLPRRRKPLW